MSKEHSSLRNILVKNSKKVTEKIIGNTGKHENGLRVLAAAFCPRSVEFGRLYQAKFLSRRQRRELRCVSEHLGVRASLYREALGSYSASFQAMASVMVVFPSRQRRTGGTERLDMGQPKKTFIME